jgi:hypothetical protein
MRYAEFLADESQQLSASGQPPNTAPQRLSCPGPLFRKCYPDHPSRPQMADKSRIPAKQIKECTQLMFMQQRESIYCSSTASRMQWHSISHLLYILIPVLRNARVYPKVSRLSR